MTIREIYKNSEQFLNKEVKLGGWIRSIRGSKHFGFLVLHDGTFFKPIQVVYEEKLENFQEISKMNVGAAVIVEGTLVPTPQAKQPFEIQAATVTLEGASAPDYPLQKKRHSLEYLRTISHLRPRTNTFQAVFRIRSMAAYAIHQFFQERGFVYVHTPLITASDCEGAGEMFQVSTLDFENLKGKEIGKGIRQRKDGRYEARITIKGSGKPPFSIYGTNLQQVRKQRSMYLAEVLPGVPGFDSSMSVSKWYEKWMELYKVRNLKATTIRNYEEKYGKES